MRDSFSDYHPLINLIYFITVLGFSMILSNPVCAAISLLGAVIYLIVSEGKKTLKTSLCWLLPMFLLVAVINPAFSHAGVTILMYFPDGNPLTLESICYGISAGAVFAAVICWFMSVNRVMTGDKLVYLFGRIVPALSLMISMTLRFVPLLRRQAGIIINAQRCAGRDIYTGGVFKRLKNGFAVLSILITWSLENAIDTADSMRSRAYGFKGRTAYAIYKFEKRDRLMLLWLVAGGVYEVLAAVSRVLYWQYYPMIKGHEISVYQISAIVVYFLICFTPVIINLNEERQWRKLKSTI